MHRCSHPEPAGNVAQDVDPPEALDHGLYRGIDLHLVEQVRRREQPARIRTPVFLGQLVEPATDERQIRTALEKSIGHGPAEIAGRTGDENRLLGESHVIVRIA